MAVRETVAFLFCDLEGSTRLLSSLGMDTFGELLSTYGDIVAKAAEPEGGRVENREGDGLFLVFPTAAGALRAAVRAQQAMADQPWPQGAGVAARMGVHAGEAEAFAGGYVGMDVHRTARVTQAAWGGQVLVSDAIRVLAADALPGGVELRDLGEHRLRDLDRPEQLYQVVAPGLRADFPPLRTLEGTLNNLPLQATSFVGREQELAEVAKLLGGTRLVTLTGVGGSGKTRLALQAAARMLPGFPDGVWLVELAGVADPKLVPHTIALALGLRESTEGRILELLVGFLRDRRLLLILDNCEHLLETTSGLADTLLREAPELTILATSREILGVAGEVPYQLHSLSTPDAEERLSRQALARYDAIRLFCERAEAVRPGFRLSEVNAHAVTQICRRLDGLPLAIELAVARLRVLSPEQIADRLDDRFRLLTGGVRTALPRQQTLEAAVEWSYDLLTKEERRLFERLAVFAGGFSLEAAEEVCVDDRIEGSDILDLLGHLVEKSLVETGEQDGRARYRMLETLRQFGLQKLAARGDVDAVRRRHASHFLGLAEEWERHSRGPDQAAWWSMLHAEHPNFRSALGWALGVGQADTAYRLVGSLEGFWTFGEGIEWVERVLAMDQEPPPAARISALLTAVSLLGPQEPSRAEPLAEETLELARELADPNLLARALYAAGEAAYFGYEYEEALALLEEAEQRFRELGDDGRRVPVLSRLGQLLELRGYYDRALIVHEEAVALARESGGPYEVIWALLALGLALERIGDFERAGDLLERALGLARDVRPDEIGHAAMHLGGLLIRRGELDRAQPLLHEGRDRLERQGDRRCLTRALTDLAWVALERGSEEVPQLLRQALLLSEKIGHHGQVVRALELMAVSAARRGEPERGARLLAATDRLRRQFGLPSPVERSLFEERVSALKGTLDQQSFEHAWQEGAALSREEAVAEALRV